MAGEDNSKMDKQSSVLDMESLIGEPLKVVHNAKEIKAASSKKIVQDVKMDKSDKNAEEKIITTEFYLKDKSHSDGGDNDSECLPVDVPILSIINIPTLSLDEVDVTFDMEVKSSKRTPDKEEEFEAIPQIRLGALKTGVIGSVTSCEVDRRVGDDSKKKHIELHKKDCGTAEDLARVLDILKLGSTPAKVEDEQDESK